MDIEDLCEWDEGRTVMTRNGPRFLRKAEPSPEFWAAWRSDKTKIKAEGVSVSHDDDSGDWEVCWWSDPDESNREEHLQAIADSSATDAAIEIPCPAGKAYMPFQKAGIAYALGRKATLIADEMGLGKTIQAIGLINALTDVAIVVVVCPASLKINWLRELQSWLVSPRRIAIAGTYDWESASVVIVNYEQVEKYGIHKAGASLAIIDEAHYAKNPKAHRSKVVYELLSNCDRKVCLTGTPIPNRPAEIYGLVNALCPGEFGSWPAFSARYCEGHRTRFGWEAKGCANLNELHDLLRSKCMVRRLKADVLTELPAKRRQVIVLPASGDSPVLVNERRIAAEAESRLAAAKAEVEANKGKDEEAYKRAVWQLVQAQRWAFTELSRVRHETALEKCPAVIEHVADALEEVEKVVVFAHHLDVLEQIAKHFGPAATVITGEVTLKQRQEAVDRFQNDPSCKVFVGSITAAGVGLTLTASSTVFFAELDWVPGNLTQAEDRCHRIGQANSVLVQHVVLDGSIDEKLAKTVLAKQEVIRAALDGNSDESDASVLDSLLASSAGRA